MDKSQEIFQEFAQKCVEEKIQFALAIITPEGNVLKGLMGNHLQLLGANSMLHNDILTDHKKVSANG